MGQNFWWFCISANQTLGDSGKYGEWLKTDAVDELLPLLGKGFFVPENPLQDKEASSSLAITDGIENRTTFASLPPEIHTHIYELVDDIVDALCFAITCTYVWNIGFNHLCVLREMTVAPWMGGSIICLGDYATTLPQHVLNDPDIPNARLVQEYSSKNDDEGNRFNKADRSPEILSKYLYDVHTRQYEQNYRTAWMNGTDVVNGYLFRMVCECFGVKFGPVRRRQDNQDWTLRNLTRHLYVRESDLSDFLPLRDRYKLGLGHVLAAYCGWSQDYTVSYAVECELHNGAWAGHRFDIVPYNEDESWTKDSDWKNVREEVRERLNFVFYVHADS